MADGLWYEERDVPGVGRQIEVWAAGGGVVRFTWFTGGGPVHVELSSHMNQARSGAHALTRIMNGLARRRITNPSPGQLLWVLRC